MLAHSDSSAFIDVEFVGGFSLVLNIINLQKTPHSVCYMLTTGWMESCFIN